MPIFPSNSPPLQHPPLSLSSLPTTMAPSHIKLLLLLLVVVHVEGRSPRRPKKLLVFGDSYADTGNLLKIIAPSWHEPYGITFPGKPAGRFSDGRTFTDFLARFLKIRSPIPYRYRRLGKKLLPYGMNFAVGGSGVFDTVFFQKNLTVQIDELSEQIAEGVFTKADLRSSVAAISISGNDYLSYEAMGGTMEGLKGYMTKIINQIKIDLKRLHDMGIAKVAVTNLHPTGCTPYITRSISHSHCNTSANKAASDHNKLLSDALRDLNMKAGGSPFVILDLNHAFSYIIKHERRRFPNVLEPCCAGLKSENSCGDEDLSGNKLYRVCSRRNSYFYWDNLHPTQAGWCRVFSILGYSLRCLYI